MMTVRSDFSPPGICSRVTTTVAVILHEIHLVPIAPSLPSVLHTCTLTTKCLCVQLCVFLSIGSKPLPLSCTHNIQPVKVKTMQRV